MLKYLRMDMYRLVKGKMLWVTLGLLLAAAVFMTFMMWWSTTPDFAEVVNAQAEQNGGAPSSTGWSFGVSSSAAESLNDTIIDDFTLNHTSMWVGGGMLAAFVSVVVALFFAADFTSGYVKNLPSSRRARLAYYGEKILFVVLLSTVFLVFCIAMFETFLAVAGFTYARVGPAVEIAVWFGLSVLIISTYAMLAAVVVWLTRSKAAGLATALVVGSCTLEGIVASIVQNLPFSWVLEWIPFHSYQLLRQGGEALLASPGDIGHIVVVCGAVLVACIVVTLGVCARKDV